MGADGTAAAAVLLLSSIVTFSVVLNFLSLVVAAIKLVIISSLSVEATVPPAALGANVESSSTATVLSSAKLSSIIGSTSCCFRVRLEPRRHRFGIVEMILYRKLEQIVILLG